jgi:hypothetical protein
MGGGGDGGAGARAEEQERRRAQARDALNLYFGVAPTSGGPRREDFTRAGSTSGEGDGAFTPNDPGSFDQAGYDAAMAAFSQSAEQAQRNKSALDALYGGIRQKAFDSGKMRLDEDNTAAQRDTRFELLARGLGGGSVDIDQNAALRRIYDQGRLDLGSRADAAATAFRTNDESTRMQLLQGIDSGMDQGTAISSALNQMRNNSDRASAEAQGTTLGNIFGDAGMLYGRDRRARGERRANATWDTQSSNPYSMGRGSRQGISSNAFDG